MSRLYMIRHGSPSSTWGGADDDPGLDPTGHAQAQAARDWLLALPTGDRPQRVVSSPLRRCRETAEPTARALGISVEIDPRVGELPTPKGLAREARPAWLQTAFQGTWDKIPGDRDYEAWRREVVASLAQHADTAVFSHYLAINAVLSHLAGDPRVLFFRPDHTSISVFETDGTRLSLVSRGREAATGVL